MVGSSGATSMLSFLSISGSVSTGKYVHQVHSVLKDINMMPEGMKLNCLNLVEGCDAWDKSFALRQLHSSCWKALDPIDRHALERLYFDGINDEEDDLGMNIIKWNIYMLIFFLRCRIVETTHYVFNIQSLNDAY